MVEFFMSMWYFIQFIIFLVGFVMISDIWATVDEFIYTDECNFIQKIVILVTHFREIIGEVFNDVFLSLEIHRLIRIGYCIIFAFIVMLIFHAATIKSIFDCKMIGSSYNMKTNYSLYRGECTYKTKSGANIPVRILRDTPEGKDGQTNSSNDDQFEGL